MDRGMSNMWMPGRRVAQAMALCACLACVGLFVAPAQAQATSGTAQAVIVEPLGLVKVEDLRFGRMAVGPAAGTVTVDPSSGSCSTTGGVVSGGGCGFAEFGGQGVRKLTVRIQIPASATLAGPNGATMTASSFTLGAAPDLALIGGNGNGLGNGQRRYQISSSTGIFTLRLGGQLSVGANQTPGLYTGSFAVTVQYQ